MQNDAEKQLHDRLADCKNLLETPAVITAAKELPEGQHAIKRLRQVASEVETGLDKVPQIEVAFLGPSRHGKSTLLNALASTSVLPMSDVKPCTASVVSLSWSKDWFVEIRFCSRRRLFADRDQAISEAKEYLARLRENRTSEEEADDPRHVQNILQRFVRLYEIDPDQTPDALIEAIETATLPVRIEEHLGRVGRKEPPNLEMMQRRVAEYLSTSDVFWTIVESCDIQGPFDGWHEQLRLIDLPGTNDIDPERTAITNDLREKAQAVAIVTSDSNLGIDILDWLRHSSVLAEFLEATTAKRQRLFVIRTKFDAYHPEIDESLIPDGDEEAEERLYLEAFDRHKQDQTAEYRTMLREIASPLMPAGSTEDERRKLEELKERIDKVPAYFVSALAHEAFAGRLKATMKQKRRLSEHFSDDPEHTGVPALRQYLNEMAEDYLAENYYDDLRRRLDREVDQLVRYFRKAGKNLEAALAGVGENVQAMVVSMERDVVPWIQEQVQGHVSKFREDAARGGEDIRQRMDQTWRISERRLEDKAEIWSHIAWNSLKAVGRKQGAHTTSRGKHIDVSNDICSILVDDLILAWTTYRDYLVQQRIDLATQQFATSLRARLADAASDSSEPEAAAAIQETVGQLSVMAEHQREYMLGQVDTKIRQLESIRQPSYDFIAKVMSPTFTLVGEESGVGCQRRMHEHLVRGLEANMDSIKSHIYQLVTGAVDELMEHCSLALNSYGQTATLRIEDTIEEVREIGQLKEREAIEKRLDVIEGALLALPAPPEN